jgi:hypothetical protein
MREANLRTTPNFALRRIYCPAIFIDMPGSDGKALRLPMACAI